MISEVHRLIRWTGIDSDKEIIYKKAKVFMFLINIKTFDFLLPVNRHFAVSLKIFVALFKMIVSEEASVSGKRRGVCRFKNKMLM